jgi:uncharacterized RDD family membrane protein YckC
MAKYADVQQALQAAELETARELLRGYLETEPDSAEAWYLAAQAAVNDKQRRYFLEKAVEFDPLHAEAGNELHALLRAAGEFAPAPKPQPQPKPKVIPAPLLNRAVAFMIDHAMLLLMTFFLRNIAALLTNVVNNPEAIGQTLMLWMLLSTIVYVAYFGYGFTEGQGQTIGKRMMGVRVIKRNGKPLGWGDAFVRCWVGYLLSAAPLGLGFVWAIVDEDKRGWHDIIADTQVVQV